VVFSSFAAFGVTKFNFDPAPSKKHNKIATKMDMNVDTASHRSGHSMAMAFTNVHNTPLFSTQWTPSTIGAYAGTCIFLIVLALISRMLASYRYVLESKWHDRHVNRRYITVSGEPIGDQEKADGPEAASEDNNATLTVEGLREQVMVIRSPIQRGVHVAPWKFDMDLPRACIFTVQHGVGYLL
jgi:hypothetical protein